MAEPLDPAAYIYEGIWTDWSKGNQVWGLTWTLCPDNAVLVTSSLAVFVTLAGSQLWSITRFTLHQAGAKSQAASPSTPNHKKEQVILRNATTDLATARLMAYLAWKSRRRAGRIHPRTLTIAFVALLHALLFMAAGTFSNLAISAGSATEGSMVLSRSRHCGTWNQTYLEIASLGNNVEDDEKLFMSVEYTTKREHNIQLSLEYAQKCYLNEESYGYMSSICNTLKKPRLRWTTERNGSCPFAPGTCVQDAAVIIKDTGDMDSHLDLGINAKPSDRLKYRRITHCAVLDDGKYVRGWDGVINATTQGPRVNQTGDKAMAYYGPSYYKNTDWTYSYTNFAQFFDNFTAQVTIPYQVDAETAWAPADPAWSYSDFEPIDEIVQEAADVTLFFLSYSGTYRAQVDDPWFSAHRFTTFEDSPPILQTRLARDRAISTIGCTEKHRFCTPGGVCTPMGGFDQIQNDESFNTALTSHQNATFDRMLRAATAGSIKAVVDGLRVTSTPLLAVSQMAVGSTVVSLPLPPDQWERELEYWQSVAMAQVQRTVVQYATGQVAAQARYLIPAEEEQDRWFCDNFTIPSTVYQSFSIMKMILIVVFGALVIIISLNIEAIARLFRRCFRKAEARVDWEDDDMLKLRGDMRESLWPPSLPSPCPPPVPPKSPFYQGASPPQRPDRSPEFRSTIRYVPGSLSSGDQEWKRSSSPTLPIEDRPVSVMSNTLLKPPDKGFLAPPGPIYRHDRDSWMAISLNDVDATTQAVPTQPLDVDEAATRALPRSPMFQRFRNPMQFHLPRPQGSWV